jgi:hypothetical protein
MMPAGAAKNELEEIEPPKSNLGAAPDDRTKQVTERNSEAHINDSLEAI